jgi:uncharacterized protein (TIGR02246 family)
MKNRITLLTLNLALAASVFAAEPSATPLPEPKSSPQVASSPSGEIQSITELDRDYEAAYNRADANAVAAFYTNDAEYVDEEGTAVSGRDAIEKLLVEEFNTNPGAKLKIDVESVRVLSPDVLVEKGIATGADNLTQNVASCRVDFGKGKPQTWLLVRLPAPQLPQTPTPVAATSTPGSTGSAASTQN